MVSIERKRENGHKNEASIVEMLSWIKMVIPKQRALKCNIPIQRPNVNCCYVHVENSARLRNIGILYKRNIQLETLLHCTLYTVEMAFVHTIMYVFPIIKEHQRQKSIVNIFIYLHNP